MTSHLLQIAGRLLDNGAAPHGNTERETFSSANVVMLRLSVVSAPTVGLRSCCPLWVGAM